MSIHLHTQVQTYNVETSTATPAALACLSSTSSAFLSASAASTSTTILSQIANKGDSGLSLTNLARQSSAPVQSTNTLTTTTPAQRASISASVNISPSSGSPELNATPKR